MASPDEWASAFADAYGHDVPIEQQVYAQVLGEQHPSELDTYSCLTQGELTAMEHWLALRAGDDLVDLGCGRGGVGVWLAGRSGAQLYGVDVTEAPFAAARTRAAAADVAATFSVGTLDATGLPDGVTDAVVSVDALQFAQDREHALREVVRILRPGGRLALTAAEPTDDLDGVATAPSTTAAHAEAAGLVVTRCSTPPDWPDTARRISAAMLAASDAIANQTGSDRDEVRDALDALATSQTQERRVLLLAHRP